jgi:putative hydrolase of the HAD superfamily
MLDVIAFDADDTLWDSEILYVKAKDEFSQLLSAYRDPGPAEEVLDETERRNLGFFGYGIKSFTLSMIETAVDLTDGRIRGEDVRQIVGFAKRMKETPVQLLDHVEEVVEKLSRSHELMLITKGDLFDQEAKIAASGLAGFFRHVEIVSEKDPRMYEALLARHGIDPQCFLMVGNSLRSDVLPVVAVGGQAVHIPHHTTWVHEIVSDQDVQGQSYFELDHIGLLPALVEQLTGG